MKTTEVFNRNVKAVLDGYNLIINQGGTSSSKSYSILQALYLKAKNDKRPTITSAVSYALPHLKLGIIRDFETILMDDGVIPENIRNKTENTYQIGKSLIEFWGCDNMAKVHGPRRDRLFINECNHIKHDVYTQLRIRTKGLTFLDYNPTQEFWVHTDVIPTERHAFIQSTYKDNIYLDQSIIDVIEARRNNENWWRVYGLGEVGRLEGVIIKNWKYGEFDTSLPYGYGLDFGYHPDPDALVKIAIDARARKIYVKECFYLTNQGTDKLRQSILQHVSGRDLIIADSASPRVINDIRASGFNIAPCYKFAGSVLEGLRALEDYELIITPESFNLSKELNNYTWSDKKAGIPIDAFNHLIDAIRIYVQYQHYAGKRRGMTIIE